MLILGLLGMYFDAAVVFVTKSSLFFRLAPAILCSGSTRLKVKNKWFGRGIKASVRVPILTLPPVFFFYLTHNCHMSKLL